MSVGRLGVVVACILGGPVSATWAQSAAGPVDVMCPKVNLARKAASVDCGSLCGTDRWGIKTLSDRMRRQVTGPPVLTTVAALAAIPRPSRRPQQTRLAPVERTIYCVEAWLLTWEDQEDEDVHIVLMDPQDGRTTMIAEIPQSRCAGACSSGYAHLFTAARNALRRGIAAATADTVRVRVMGVGFFDKDHGQTWAAPNFVELHPVLGIEFPRARRPRRGDQDLDP